MESSKSKKKSAKNSKKCTVNPTYYLQSDPSSYELENTEQEPQSSSNGAKQDIDKKNSKIDFDEEPLIRERDQFLSLCIRNRLYTNPNYAMPWKIFSRLSQQLTNELIEEMEDQFNSGVKNFVDDFLKLETSM